MEDKYWSPLKITIIGSHKKYNPKEVEKDKYKEWLKKDYFKCDENIENQIVKVKLLNYQNNIILGEMEEENE